MIHDSSIRSFLVLANRKPTISVPSEFPPSFTFVDACSVVLLYTLSTSVPNCAVSLVRLPRYHGAGVLIPDTAVF